MQELVDPFERLLNHRCPPATVREIEAGGDWRPLWAAIEEAGYLDALLPAENGGFGLSLADVAPLIALVGANAVPLPVAETMVARALLAASGQPIPDGPVVLATGRAPTLLGAIAGHALVGPVAAPSIRALDGAAGSIPGTLDRSIDAGDDGLRAIAAVLRAQHIAGAADRVLAMSVDYSNDRHQFGKPIGRQQAVQQQLAVLAEHAVAARICAGIGVRGGISPPLRDVAVAKVGTAIAAREIAALAHAVHGAIGISEEFDLQLLTRRLHAWRLADGSARYWSGQLGRAALGTAPDVRVSALSIALARPDADSAPPGREALRLPAYLKSNCSFTPISRGLA